MARQLSSVEFGIPGAPVPKGRPRKGRGGRMFTPKRTRDAEDKVAWHARIMRGTFTGPVVVWLDFYGGRGDIDNLAKLVLDGLQKGGLLVNDSQVERLELAHHPADGQPRTVVRVEDA